MTDVVETVNAYDVAFPKSVCFESGYKFSDSASCLTMGIVVRRIKSVYVYGCSWIASRLVEVPRDNIFRRYLDVFLRFENHRYELIHLTHEAVRVFTTADSLRWRRRAIISVVFYTVDPGPGSENGSQGWRRSS